MALFCNPEESAKRRKRAEAVLAQRAKFVSTKGEPWTDINCDEGCRGWDVFETSGRSGRYAPAEGGFGVQACDDCNRIAAEHGLSKLSDVDAKHLPEARRLHQRHVREFGSSWERSSHPRYGDEDPQENPKSMLTGPKWEATREKLRGAAAGTRKNPPKGEIQIMREVTALLQDPDPEAMKLAEDLMLETGTTLASAGMWNTNDPMKGKFVLDVEPGNYYDRHRLHLGPHDSAKNETSSGWKIEQHSPSNFMVTLEYWYRGRRDEILSGSHYKSLRHAQQTGAADAWTIAKAIKTWGGTSDLRTRVLQAYSNKLPEVEGPLQLYREEFDATNLDEEGRFVRSNPTAPKEALDKYEEFHRYKPTKIGEFKRGFEIPSKMYEAGAAKWTTYRSGKVDPSTLQKPRRPVNYIHEHDAGVRVYLPVDDASSRDLIPELPAIRVVPREFREVDALVKLGDSLGFCFEHGGEEIEAEGEAPLPELYCSADGKCLYVVQDKSDVLAMIWGGGLGVFARGIDG